MTTNPPPGELVEVEGHALHLVHMGQCGPAIVFDAGLGGSSLDWSRVAPELASVSRVCIYDRAGYGWSEPGRRPRTSARIVAELRELLRQAQIPAPYILVGHSFGALNMRLFASEAPDEVAGLVLVDASHETRNIQGGLLIRIYDLIELAFVLICRVLAALGLLRLALRVPDLPLASSMLRKYPPAVRRTMRSFYASPRFWSTVYDEDVVYERSLGDVRLARRPLGDLPLLVIARESLGGWQGLFGGWAQRAWRRFQEDIAGLSTNSRLILVRQTGHYIHLDRPEVVIAAIREMVDTVCQSARVLADHCQQTDEAKEG